MKFTSRQLVHVFVELASIRVKILSIPFTVQNRSTSILIAAGVRLSASASGDRMNEQFSTSIVNFGGV